MASEFNKYLEYKKRNPPPPKPDPYHANFYEEYERYKRWLEGLKQVAPRWYDTLLQTLERDKQFHERLKAMGWFKSKPKSDQKPKSQKSKPQQVCDATKPDLVLEGHVSEFEYYARQELERQRSGGHPVSSIFYPKEVQEAERIAKINQRAREEREKKIKKEIKKIAKESYEKAGLKEKILLHASTFLSKRSFSYAAAALLPGKSTKDVVIEHLAEYLETTYKAKKAAIEKGDEALENEILSKYWAKETLGAIESIPGVAGTSILGGAILSRVLSKLGIAGRLAGYGLGAHYAYSTAKDIRKNPKEASIRTAVELVGFSIGAKSIKPPKIEVDIKLIDKPEAIVFARKIGKEETLIIGAAKTKAKLLIKEGRKIKEQPIESFYVVRGIKKDKEPIKFEVVGSEVKGKITKVTKESPEVEEAIPEMRIGRAVVYKGRKGKLRVKVETMEDIISLQTLTSKSGSFILRRQLAGYKKGEGIFIPISEYRVIAEGPLAITITGDVIGIGVHRSAFSLTEGISGLRGFYKYIEPRRHEELKFAPHELRIVEEYIERPQLLLELAPKEVKNIRPRTRKKTPLDELLEHMRVEIEKEELPPSPTYEDLVRISAKFEAKEIAEKAGKPDEWTRYYEQLLKEYGYKNPKFTKKEAEGIKETLGVLETLSKQSIEGAKAEAKAKVKPAGIFGISKVHEFLSTIDTEKLAETQIHNTVNSSNNKFTSRTSSTNKNKQGESAKPKQSYKQTQKQKDMQREKDININIISEIGKDISDETQRSSQKSSQKQSYKQTQKLTQIKDQINKLEFDIPNFIIPPDTPAKGAPFKLDFNLNIPTCSSRKSKEKEDILANTLFAYQPSLLGVLFDIKASKKFKLKDIFTGFEIRGI